MGDPRTRTALAVGSLAAGCAAVLLLAAPTARSTGPLDPERVSAAIERLSPMCRRIAERRLRTRLDSGVVPWIDDAELHRVVDPLARGGNDACDAITGQSFLLGGT